MEGGGCLSVWACVRICLRVFRQQICSDDERSTSRMVFYANRNTNRLTYRLFREYQFHHSAHSTTYYASIWCIQLNLFFFSWWGGGKFCIRFRWRAMEERKYTEQNTIMNGMAQISSFGAYVHAVNTARTHYNWFNVPRHWNECCILLPNKAYKVFYHVKYRMILSSNCNRVLVDRSCSAETVVDVITTEKTSTVSRSNIV